MRRLSPVRRTASPAIRNELPEVGRRTDKCKRIETTQPVSVKVERDHGSFRADPQRTCVGPLLRLVQAGGEVETSTEIR
jgi:hypothetical protein